MSTNNGEVSPLFNDAGMLSAWKQTMHLAMGGEATQPIKRQGEPHLLESMGTINIVEYLGQYYALPQSLGPVDFHVQDVSSLPGVLIADDLTRMRAQLQSAQRRV